MNKKRLFVTGLLVLTLVMHLAVAAADETDDWMTAPVITKAYEQSVGRIYIEWDGQAPIYQVYLDGSKIADTIVNHHTLNVEEGTHSVIVYPVNQYHLEADTKIQLGLSGLGEAGVGGDFSIDLAAFGLDPKELATGNPSETLRFDYEKSQIMNGIPERISAYTDPENRVVLSFEDPYVADDYRISIKRGNNMNYVTYHRNGEREKDLISETGSMVSLVLDQEFLRTNECFIPEINEEYRFNVQFRKYATDYVTGEKEISVFSDSKVSSDYVYRLIPIWKTAPIITFASQTADSQLTLMWDHEDYGAGVEYSVVKINKILGVATGEDKLGSTKEHEFIVNDINNGGYCINIVPVLNGEKGSYSADANVEIKNEWVIAPSLSCEQIGDNQIKLTWKAPANIERYHITVLRGDNNSLLRFVDLDFSKYSEFDVDAVEGDMEYTYTYDDQVDSENGTKLKFEIYGVRRTTSGGEQNSAVSGKTVILK